MQTLLRIAKLKELGLMTDVEFSLAWDLEIKRKKRDEI